MEVTRSNFDTVLPRAIKAIRNADFIAIDTELSGLHASDEWVEEWLDLPAERYEKLRHNCESLLITQFGLCTFEWHEKNQCFYAKPFTFYMFPTSQSQFGGGKRFVVESQALDFVAQNGFDFNKWVKEGVSWLTPAEEEAMKLKVRNDELQREKDKEMEENEPDDIKCDSKPDQEFLDDTCGLIEQWLDTRIVPKGWTEENSSSGRRRKCLILPGCNSFRRRLLFKTIPRRFPGVFAEPHSRLRTATVSVSKMSQVEMREREEARKQRQIDRIDDALGVRRVFDAMLNVMNMKDSDDDESERKEVPLIVHNGLLDIGMMMTHFSTGLPSDYLEFKARVHSMFPVLIDTKHIVKSSSLGSLFPNDRSSLEDCHTTVMKSSIFKNLVDINIAPEIASSSSFSSSSCSYHSAGYDAYATGFVYARVSKKLGETMMLMQENCVNMTRSEGYICFNGDDPIFDRDHVFYAFNIPHNTSAGDVQNSLRDVSAVRVHWLDQCRTCAFVTLIEPDKAELVRSRFCGRFCPELGFELTTYENARSVSSTTTTAGAGEASWSSWCSLM